MKGVEGEAAGLERHVEHTTCDVVVDLDDDGWRGLEWLLTACDGEL